MEHTWKIKPADFLLMLITGSGYKIMATLNHGYITEVLYPIDLKVLALIKWVYELSSPAEINGFRLPQAKHLKCWSQVAQAQNLVICTVQIASVWFILTYWVQIDWFDSYMESCCGLWKREWLLQSVNVKQSHNQAKTRASLRSSEVNWSGTATH